MLVQAGYYRCVADHDEVVVGRLVYAVTSEEAGKVDVLIGNRRFIYDLDEFESVYELAPEGAAENQAEVEKLMHEITDAENGFTNLSTQMLEFHPHMEGDELAGGGALVPQDTPRTPAVIKRAVAQVRNTIAKTKKALDVKRQELINLLDARSTALQLRVDEMNRLVAKANEAIWTINLYMGKDEEIHRLAKGEVAPKEEPITLRQRILYMDEECTLLANDQGIDVQQLEMFDKWLLEDDHLDTLLPEPKGIVCLHARSRRKKYADPWTSAQMNQANLCYTYFLIRNGGNVYRIYADIVLGSVMFPDDREYRELFRRTGFNWETRKSETKVIRPGDDDYMKAMDKCEEKQRHYLRILLILQGLLDRTNIFKPLLAERINICNKADYFKFLRFVYDTGESVLDDGKPSFGNWLREVNSGIDVGHRVIGAFGSYRAGVRGHMDGGHRYGVRVYPANAETPSQDELHTITRMEKDAHESDKYYFTYDRGEIWDQYDGFRQSLTRASCFVHRDDTWVLDFDAAEVADIEYYKHSRKGKKEYQDMVPILDLALKMKAAEEIEEKPFRQLLAGQLSQHYSIGLEKAIAAVPELVRWWKFKNRTHRALVSNDVKALNMIVAEFGIRERREAERAILALRHENVVAEVKRHADPVLVAHKSKNKYVALIPHNDENIWVREQTWTLNRTTGAIYMNDEKEWKLVDKRHERWEIVYKIDRWDTWAIGLRPSSVLTDPEIEELIDRALEIKRARVEEEINDIGQFRRRRSWPNYDSRNRKRAQRFLPIAGGISDKGTIKIWFSDQGPILPKTRLFSRSPRDPIVQEAQVDWEKKQNGIECYVRGDGTIHGYPWGNVVEDKRYYCPIYRLFRQFDDNAAQVHAERIQAQELEARRDAMCDSVDYVGEEAAKYARQKQEQAYFAEFLADHGDPELWEDHKKTLKFEGIWTYQIEIACCLLLERQIEIVGLTIGEVIDRALPLGLLSKKKDFDNKYNKVDLAIPLDFVIPPPLEKAEEPEEDEQIEVGTTSFTDD